MVLKLKAEQWGDRGRFWSAYARCNTHHIRKQQRERKCEYGRQKKKTQKGTQIKKRSHLCSVHQKWMWTWRDQYLYAFYFLILLFVSSFHNITYIHSKMETLLWVCLTAHLKLFPQLYSTHLQGFFQHFIIWYIYCHYWTVNEEN